MSDYKLTKEQETLFELLNIGEVYDHAEKPNGLISGRAKHLVKKFLAQEIQRAVEAEKKSFFIDKNITVEIEDSRLVIKSGDISSTWNLSGNNSDKEDFYTGVYIDNENTRHWTIVHSTIHKEAHKALFEKQKNKILTKTENHRGDA